MRPNPSQLSRRTSVSQPVGPDMVVMDAAEFPSGRRIGIFLAPHDGTKAGILDTKKRMHLELEMVGYDVSNGATRWGATDATGQPAWVISPNGKIAAVGTDAAAYTLGDLTKAPKKNPKRRR